MGEVRATCHSRFSRLSLKMCCLSSLGAAVAVEGVWRGTGGAKSRSIERRDLSVTDGKNRAIPGAAKCFKMRIIEEAAWTRLGLLWISLLFLPPPVACRRDASITTRPKTFFETSSPASFTARQSRRAWNQHHVASLQSITSRRRKPERFPPRRYETVKSDRIKKQK